MPGRPSALLGGGLSVLWLVEGWAEYPVRKSALTTHIAAWNSEMNGTGDQLWIEVHPTDAKPAPAAIVRVHRRDNHIVVGRTRADAHAG